jgi:hypothetical protein
VVLVGSGVIATALELSGNVWLAFAASLLTLPELVLSSFCGTDPPAVPTFTSDEANALLQVKLGADFNSGLVKLGDLVLNNLWGQYCVCTSGAYTAPAPATIPTGTAIYQVTPTPSSTPCASGAPATSYISNGGSFALAVNVAVPAGTLPTSYVLTCTDSVYAGVGSHFNFLMNENVNGVEIATDTTTTFPITGTQSYYGTVHNPNAINIAASLHGLSGSGSDTDKCICHIDLYCSGATPGQQNACCPPDQATQNQLDLILKTVTLLQRQIAPFAYVSSTAHAGITGNGAIAVQGLIGVRVDVTTLPARAGETAGDPVDLWDVGWLNLGTADGYGPRQFVSSNPTLILPVSAAVTSIGYSIPADVVVTITELVREP